MTTINYSLRHLTPYLVLICVAGLLAACGGGSSSSGAGVSKEATPFAGQYGGVERLWVRNVFGQRVLVGVFPLSITVLNNRRVIITDADGIQFAGRLGGTQRRKLPPNRFVAAGRVFLPPFQGLRCRPALWGYNGTIQGRTIRGNMNGRHRCMFRGRGFTAVVSGLFIANRGAAGAPSVRPPGAPGNRKSRKSKAIVDGVVSTPR